jgi:2-C-methyl-D-erythritol 2,4-cyclodiphosphate synthase
LHHLCQQELQHLSLILRTLTLFRVGFGYDVHPFASGRSLIIGGINIPHEKGLAGHSDADVLIHAVIDAVLGALAKGDIGNHFPDSDPANKDLDSTLMLNRVMAWAREAGFRINNLDTTVVAEKPKLAPHIMAMRERLSDVLETPLEQINIKATTTEGMGFCGRGEGIAAYAVVSLIAMNENT